MDFLKSVWVRYPRLGLPVQPGEHVRGDHVGQLQATLGQEPGEVQQVVGVNPHVAGENPSGAEATEEPVPDFGDRAVPVKPVPSPSCTTDVPMSAPQNRVSDLDSRPVVDPQAAVRRPTAEGR